MDRDTAEVSVDSFPGERAREWVERHHEHAAPSTYVYDFVWDITEDAVGPFCTDVDGNVLLDFTAHVASAPLGYNNPKILEKLESFDLVDPMKIAGQDFYVSGGGSVEDPDLPGPTQLLDRLTDATSHYDLDTAFLSNSGAEAVENAIKICYAERGHRGVTFDGAFHGRTLGALSLNRSKAVQRRGFPEVPGVLSLPYCACEGECTCGWKTDGPGGNRLADALHPTRGPVPADELAFVILEPQQGEGGYRVANDEFARDIAAAKEEHGFKVISDEIQSGLGRTGEMWGIDHLDLDPDVITSAKGLRVGATVANENLFPEETGRLSSTWGAGDLLASAQGVATIEAIHEHDLLANVRERGRQFIDLLTDLDSEYVTDVRGRGLMLAIELDSKERRGALMKACLTRGLLTLGCGHKTLRLLPPLDATEREIDLGFAILADALDDSRVTQAGAGDDEGGDVV
ncbi:aminotransferase class III-fold pyridoxal phosphate-dependent enzyme [Halarchaeum sp. CBA1220]|uniref:aminotransferase class III-fold pyridoxal phosphate-dependent enzyme n=1 Tax=Halarchaeum sp. CBA1220 TaxID=1853682 RepID=UPI000F3A88AF|nr:aminotransferase class III-fold pyridoxal phosphate-dependent enzyme [Halarchaeum sp. CBA1220]QLC32704.1 aminotransferase class III-fold pyridoxal phosphate-dependent enzyme [Halarchaeum sp. CBA1220]